MKLKYADEPFNYDKAVNGKLKESGKYYVGKLKELAQIISDAEYDVCRIKRAISSDHCSISVGDECIFHGTGEVVKITSVSTQITGNIFSGFNGKYVRKNKNGEWSKAQIGLSCYEFSKLEKL